MKNFSLFALSIFAASVASLPCGDGECSYAPPPPCSDNSDNSDNGTLGATQGGVCTHGQWECQGNDVAQCNWGQWNVISCGDGTRCVPNDWECVAEANWQDVYNQANPATTSSSSVLSAPSPTATPVAPSGSCQNGEFRCYGDDVIQCNIDHWIIWPCATGTSCKENDWECIPFAKRR
jgi:hypothetical protein